MTLTDAHWRMLSTIAEASPGGVRAATLSVEVVARLIIAGLVRPDGGRVDDVYLTGTEAGRRALAH
jgi:hypothetical protein